MSTTFETVKAIIIEIMANDDAEAAKMADSVTTDTNLADDLNADSLDLLEIVQEVEDKFSITVSDDQAASFATVGQATVAIDALLSETA